MNPADGGLRRELYKDFELSSYYPAYIRQLTGLPGDRRYFVIPAYGLSEAVVPAHCLPARGRRELVEQQHRRLTEPVECIIEVGDNENEPPQGCEPFAAIGAGSRVFQSDALTETPVVELVPDGVASVRIAYRETPAIVVPVSGNAFLFTPAPPTQRVKSELKKQPKLAIIVSHPTTAQLRRITSPREKTVDETHPTRIEWLNSAGQVIRTLTPPASEGSSPTSVGNLKAPLESTTTLNRSKTPHP